MDLSDCDVETAVGSTNGFDTVDWRRNPHASLLIRRPASRLVAMATAPLFRQSVGGRATLWTRWTVPNAPTLSVFLSFFFYFSSSRSVWNDWDLLVLRCIACSNCSPRTYSRTIHCSLKSNWKALLDQKNANGRFSLDFRLLRKYKSSVRARSASGDRSWGTGSGGGGFITQRSVSTTDNIAQLPFTTLLWCQTMQYKTRLYKILLNG